MTNREWLNQQPNEVLVEIMKHVEGKITGCEKCVMGNTCEKMVAGDDTQGCYEAFSNWLKEERKWKPKTGEEFYVAHVANNSGDVLIRKETWENGNIYMILYAMGLCFETKQEAYSAKGRIIKTLKEIYENGSPLVNWDQWEE